MNLLLGAVRRLASGRVGQRPAPVCASYPSRGRGCPPRWPPPGSAPPRPRRAARSSQARLPAVRPTRLTDDSASEASASSSRAASKPSRVRLSSTSPTLRACSQRAAITTSAITSGSPATIRPSKLWPVHDQREDLVSPEPIACRERHLGRLGESLRRGKVLDRDGLPKRNLGSAARGVAGVALHEPIDDHLGHPPPRRELATGDRDHAAGGLIQLGLARDVNRYSLCRRSRSAGARRHRRL